MTISKLDTLAALVVIDMQKGIGTPPIVHLASEITERVAQLACAFRSHGLLVGVLVNVAGRAPGRTEASHSFDPPADWTELVPELEQHPCDYTVAKPQGDAFHDTLLHRFLRRRGVTQVVLTSIPTSIAVESIARNAHGHGYHIALVVDAMSDLDTDAHRHSVEKIFPLHGETVTTEEVLMLLSRTTVRSTGWSETRA
jgi:nicotinamidase-related amidase